jgi:hypothetical protein
MTLFVLIYDRTERRLLDLRTFAEADYQAADAFRLQAQYHASQAGLDQDIVLFQAESEESLRATHGLYFLTERQLIERMREAAKAS